MRFGDKPTKPCVKLVKLNHVADEVTSGSVYTNTENENRDDPGSHTVSLPTATGQKGQNLYETAESMLFASLFLYTSVSEFAIIA